MDKALVQKWLKLAIAAPLAYSAALVSDISTGASFLAPLMVFIILFYLSGSISQKARLIRGMWQALAIAFFFGAFVAGLGWANSVVIFLSILILGLIVQLLVPPPARLALLPLIAYNTVTVLTSASPYTAAVDSLLLATFGMLAGWLAERFFWPVQNEQALEGQIGRTFQLLSQLRQLGFDHLEQDGQLPDRTALNALEKQITVSIQSTTTALKTAMAQGRCSPADQRLGEDIIVLQTRLQGELLALVRLFQDNRSNALLAELRPELRQISQSTGQILEGLAAAIASPSLSFEPYSLDLAPWSDRLTALRQEGTTQSFNLPTRLSIYLIEYRLEGLAKELLASGTWLATYQKKAVGDRSPSLKLARP